MTDAAVIAAAHAIERTVAFRAHFHDGPGPVGDSTHPAAVAYARAALGAAQGAPEDVWDAARDRITEANEARRDERERIVQLIHLIRVLHAPVSDLGSLLVCHGCDLGPHPEGRPEWPCSTAELVFTPEEIAERTKEDHDAATA